MSTFLSDHLLDATFWTLVFAKALPLFMTLDPLGNTGIIGALIQKFDIKQQHRILRREVLIALFIMIFFYCVGAIFLTAIGVSQAAVEITGGVVFLIFAINLLFADHATVKSGKSLQEPFIVPIATPLIAGPSCLATIMLYSHESIESHIALPALFVAWLTASIVILLTPFIMRTIGKTGVRILEQVMGLLCAMIAIKMFLRGITTFLNT